MMGATRPVTKYRTKSSMGRSVGWSLLFNPQRLGLSYPNAGSDWLGYFTFMSVTRTRQSTVALQFARAGFTVGRSSVVSRAS